MLCLVVLCLVVQICGKKFLQNRGANRETDRQTRTDANEETDRDTNRDKGTNKHTRQRDKQAHEGDTRPSQSEEGQTVKGAQHTSLGLA